MLTISLVIPSYRRLNTLKKTLEILFESESLPDEIIIVDQTEETNGRADTEALCNKYSLIKYVHQNVPSLTKARNTGIQIATGEVLVFMDDDVDVRNNTFSEIREIMSNIQVGMIGGVDELSIAPSSRSSKFFCKASNKKRNIGHVTEAVYGRFPDSLNEEFINTQWAMGFFFAIRKSLIEKYNILFDEKLQYYAYAEDLDFSYRYYKIANSEGLRCIMTPRIIVKHNVSTEFRLISEKTYCMNYAHRWYLSLKLFGSVKSKLAFIWSNIGDLLLAKRYRQSRKNVIRALLFWLRNSRSIANGNFHYEKFM